MRPEQCRDTVRSIRPWLALLDASLPHQRRALDWLEGPDVPRGKNSALTRPCSDTGAYPWHRQDDPAAVFNTGDDPTNLEGGSMSWNDLVLAAFEVLGGRSIEYTQALPVLLSAC
jgi:hypothetical protein